jgi:hypothetical protein
MKVKLLKEIRKDFKFKHKNGKWHVLEYGCYYRRYINFEDALESVLSYLSIHHYKLFDWPWHGIKQQYIIKTQTRKFNKL